MKPFSALKFFKENKRKAVVSFLVLIFTVCAISLITVLINSVIDTSENVNLKPLETFSIVYPVRGEYFLKDSVINKLNANKDIEKLITMDIDRTAITLPIGGDVYVSVFFLNEDNLKIFLDKVDSKIKEGRLPNNKTNEIALHWQTMANKKWKLGDTVGSFVKKNEVLAGEYKIVGVLDGPNIVAVGTESYKMKQLKEMNAPDKPTAYLILPKEGKRSVVNNDIKTIDKNNANYSVYEDFKEQFDSMVMGIKSIILAVIIIVIFILSISSGALIYVIYMQRSDEFGIMYAMGYGKNFIKKMILKEIMSLNIISWFFGLIFSYGLIEVLNRLVYYPQGNVITMFSTSVLYYTLFIPIMVGIFSILPITIRLGKWDPILVIERRE